MIYMMFGGKYPDSDDQEYGSWDQDLVRPGQYMLGIKSIESDANSDLESLYDRKKLEWFEVVEISSPQDNTGSDYQYKVVYNSDNYRAKLDEAKRMAELKAITPDSFILFWENTGGDWGWETYPKLQNAINALLVCPNIKRWSIRSQPQGKYICKREGGFPGKEIYTSRNDASTLDQLINMWQCEAARLRDPNFDIGKD